MKILVAGFESIGSEEFNPLVDVVKMLPIVIENAFIVKLGVPALFGKSVETVIYAIDEHEPDAIIGVGQCGGRYGLTPEFVAINYINSLTSDNAGYRPKNKVVSPDGPAAYITDLPINGMVTAIKESGVPSELSYTAGTSLSNSLMYGVAHHIAKNKINAISGFLHVPYLPYQTVLLNHNEPSLSLDDIKKGLEASLSAVAIYLEQQKSVHEKPVERPAASYAQVGFNTLRSLNTSRQ